MEKKVGTFQWGNEYLAEFDENENWLVEPILPAEGVINMYGKPKTGKSYAALGMVLAIANGHEEWNGFAIHRQGNVAYLQVDTPRFEWKRRMRQIQDAGYLFNNVAIMDMKMSPYPFNILNSSHKSWLRQQLEVIRPLVLVVDTLREIHEGDENDSTDMKRVINEIAAVAMSMGIAVVFVSHSRKDSSFNAMGAESDLMDEGRGSSYVSGRMDTIIKFTGKSQGKGKPMKGHMQYKGRGAGEDKLPIYQDPVTGLIFINEEKEKQKAAVANILKRQSEPEMQYAGKPSITRMASVLLAEGAFHSMSTAHRAISRALEGK